MESKPEDSNLPASNGVNIARTEPSFVFDKSLTVAGIFKRHYQIVLMNLSVKFPSVYDESFVRDSLRRFDPWPDWTLRIWAEVLHVDMPTIPKHTIEDALRLGHFFLMEAKMDGSNKELLPKMPKINPKNIGALVGHCFASALNVNNIIEAARDKIPADQFEQLSQEASLEKLQEKVAPAVAEYLNAKPTAFIEFQEGFSEAQRKTFDKHGSRKETPLTPIYEKILSDWPKVESLSGPKALCENLSPLLGNQDFEDNYERVKKICQRMEITFKPFVKGQ